MREHPNPPEKAEAILRRWRETFPDGECPIVWKVGSVLGMDVWADPTLLASTTA